MSESFKQAITQATLRLTHHATRVTAPLIPLALRINVHVLTLQELTETDPGKAKLALYRMWAKAEEAANSRADFTGDQAVALGLLREYFVHSGDWRAMLRCGQGAHRKVFPEALAQAIDEAAREVSVAFLAEIRAMPETAPEGGWHG